MVRLVGMTSNECVLGSNPSLGDPISRSEALQLKFDLYTSMVPNSRFGAHRQKHLLCIHGSKSAKIRADSPKCIYGSNRNLELLRKPYKTLIKKCIYDGDAFSIRAKIKKCIYAKMYIW